MAKSKKDSFITYGDMEKLLSDQTGVILNAVDERMNVRISASESRILAAVDKRLVAMEARINQKIEKLTTTLDKFLKRLTDMEDEFEMMKHDINRIKRVVKDKLGVSL